MIRVGEQIMFLLEIWNTFIKQTIRIAMCTFLIVILYVSVLYAVPILLNRVSRDRIGTLSPM